jgi:Rap1a immunity proteins
MKLAVYLLAVLSFLAVAAQGQKEKRKPRVLYEPPHFYTAETFLEMNEADRLVYASGLFDGFGASALFGATNETIANLASCTKDMDSKQVSAIITKYMKDHPEKWHLPASVEAFKALNDVCPGILK